MGKKRRGPTLDELLARPWCYYCERDFDDLKILISHQKAKHFKCERCGRRLNTAGGLSVHMSQVHKEQLSSVDNALPNRSSLDVEIFGMEGVPEDVIQAHNQRVVTQFQQAEAERQAVTGNPPPGTGSGGQPAKKPKLESVSDIKKRLAEHKAKKAEARAGGSSGEATPIGAGQTGFGTPGQPVPAYGATPPPFPPQQPAQQPLPQTHTPPQTASYMQRQGSLPAAPSLPQRPVVGAPQVNAYQMQQMHMGHTVHGTTSPAGVSNGDKTAAPETAQISSSVDDLISGAAKAADQAATGAPAPEEKAPKKDKSKARLVYSDNETSPEEKMARLPRYAFVPGRRGETVLEAVPPVAVAGATRDSDTVVDAAD
ncbi:hypothetical protein ATERTT37_005545 [Aspergillus terreus]